MTRIWTSRAGVTLRDLVPQDLRQEWVTTGLCPDKDLYTLFREHVDADPSRSAVVDDHGTVDYATLDRAVRGTAAALRHAGLNAHDIIAVQAPNSRRAIAAELAVAALGAVALPVPPGVGRAGCAGLLRRSRAAAALVSNVDGTLARAEPPTVLALGKVDPADFQPVPVDPTGPARILVTSGSEAEPKMIAYPHHAMAGGRGNYLAALHDGPAPVRAQILVPLASSYGSCGIVILARLGGTLILHESFDAAQALASVQAATHLFAVPTMLSRMAARREPADLSGLRVVVSSGAALPERTARACEAKFGLTPVDVYGSADGVNCHNAGDPGNSPRPRPEVAEIRIRLDDGRWAPPGVAGEVCARGPMTPWCYVNAPELDDRYRLPGGWVRSGDRGVLDEDGYLRVLSRIKQVVVRGGYNISPAAVERELATHPAVAEAACVGVPDEDLGERLCACVVQHPGTAPLTVTELAAYLRRERGLSRAQLPEIVVLLPELPVGPTGKVCRRTLTDLAQITR